MAIPVAIRMLLSTCILGVALSSVIHAKMNKGASLPRAYAKPPNADPKLDCAVKELAWEYAKKLQPMRGSFSSVYDALQLHNCTSTRKSKARTDKPFSPSFAQSSEAAPALEWYADSSKGSDSNPGTIDRPVKTIQRAVELSRGSPPLTNKVIYLRAGTFYLSDTIKLTETDSFLTLTSYNGERAVVSGGKLYTFSWEQFHKGMGPLLIGTSGMAELGVVAGESSNRVRYYGHVGSAEECRYACEKETSCFSFTYHGAGAGAFASMCYFREDGIWWSTPSPHCTSGKKIDIFVADLSSQHPNSFTSLFINGRRAVRARYPDGNPETMGLHTNPTGYVPSADQWLPPKTYSDATEIDVGSPVRERVYFPQFRVGLGGPVSMLDPPVSYWGVQAPIGGSRYEVPSGLQYPADVGFVNRTWSNPVTGIVHAFQCGHWGNWQFQLSGRDSANRQLLFAYGGWQEARGCSAGAEWYVENIFEELDAPGEWFYNEIEQKLYLYPNDTLPSEGIGTVLDRAVEVVGIMQFPVTQVSITNITFAHTATTFLRPYEVPSGGDWSVHRGGTVFAEGVKGFTVMNCLFDAPGGNALFISKYARDVSIDSNEIVWSGDSGIVVIGEAELIDGTNGNQPRGVTVIANLVHENGVFGKQTSAYVQSVACQTKLSGNVFFNGPRAGINFNDGFGGGNVVANNLVFNHVRETGDHGPFNSWDRQPYLTTVRYGVPSLTPAQSNITRNFLINNYHSTWPIDHDDGSCYYYDTFNYMIYGGYKSYLGHTHVVQNNVYVYPDMVHYAEPAAFPVYPYCAASDSASRGTRASGFDEHWTNNTCIIGNAKIYEFSSCDPKDPKDLVPFTADNKFYAPNKTVYIKCGNVNFTLPEYQKLGYDIGSTVADPVDIHTIIKWGKELLGL